MTRGRLLSAMLVGVVWFAGDGADLAKREILAAAPPKRIELLAALPDRMEKWSEGERKAIAPFLLGLLAADDSARLHPSLLLPLATTGTAAGVRAVLGPFYSREATPLRAAAREALRRAGGERVTDLIAGFLRRDESPRARALLGLVLGDRRDRAATETLLGALSDPAPMVRSAAAEALTRIYDRCRGYDPAAWRKYLANPAAPAPAAAPAPEKPAPPPAKGAPGEVVTKAEPPAPPARGDDAAGQLVPEFYGIRLEKPVVVVVLDFSGSVRGPGADIVKRELGKSLALLPTVRRFTVVAFDDRLLTLTSGPVPADPDAKEALGIFLDHLPPGRRTDLLTPLGVGIGLARRGAKEEGGAQVLIISDGAPTVAGPPLAHLVDESAKLADEGVRVDAAVYGGRPVGLFRYLVRTTDGKNVALPSPR